MIFRSTRNISISFKTIAFAHLCAKHETKILSEENINERKGKILKFYKYDLIDLVSEETGFYKNEIEEVFNSIIHNIPKMMDCGDKLYIKGFGSFICEETKERYGRNPSTNERIIIHSRKKLKFKSSEVLYNEC